MNLTYTSTVHFGRMAKGALQMREGEVPVAEALPAGRVPRISRLMALALSFEQMLAKGEVKDMAELARVGHVSRARVTQIMNLLMLAPDIQESLLFLPATVHGHDPLPEWKVRPIAAEMDWRKQRAMWRQIQPQVSTVQF